MRTFIVIMNLVFATVSTCAQVTPEAFLGMMPKITGSACSKDIDQRTEFTNKIEEVRELIDNELSRRDEEDESSSEEFETQTMKKMAKQYSLSEKEKKNFRMKI